MTAIRSTFLRRLIAADAAACLLGGAVFVLDAAMLETPLGLSPQLLKPVGLFLIVYALVLAALASRPALPRAVVWTLVAFNLAWAIESVGLVALGFADPTPLGLGVILVQAAGALVVGDFQFLALRRARREAMA